MRLLPLTLLAILASASAQGSELYVDSSTGNVGIGTTAPVVSVDASTRMDAIALPAGTTANRPTGGALLNSELRYNSSTLAIEAYVNGGWTSLAIGSSIIGSSGRLQCGGANCSNSTGSATLNFCPYKGNIKTTASQGDYMIPSGCLSATTTSMYVNGTASTSLSANTLYYIYLWNNAGTWVLDASTTAHATDSNTGIEIKSGDNTRTLVGMVHTDGSKHVMSGGQTNTAGDTNTVATWDNRLRTKTQCAFTASRSASGTLGEVNSENRCLFLSWGDAAYLSSAQLAFVTHQGDTLQSEIDLDGTSPQCSFLSIMNNVASNTFLAVAPGGCTPSEGYHYTALEAKTSAGGGATFSASEPQFVMGVQ